MLLTIAAEYLHSVERRPGSLHAFVRLRGRRRYSNTVGIKMRLSLKEVLHKESCFAFITMAVPWHFEKTCDQYAAYVCLLSTLTPLPTSQKTGTASENVHSRRSSQSPRIDRLFQEPTNRFLEKSVDSRNLFVGLRIEEV